MKYKLLITVILLLIFTVISLAIALIYIITKDTKDNSNNIEPKITYSLDVISPQNNSSVSGEIKMQLNSENIKSVEVEIEDSNGQILANESIEILTPDHTFPVIVSKLPSSQNGKITIKSSEGNISKTVAVSFTKPQVQDRIIVSNLLESQIISSPITLKGSMRDFFEATMNYRIVDESGNKLKEGIIMANDDNYGQFAPFEETINFDSSSGSQIELILYEISMKDGNEEILLKIPLKTR